MKAQILFVDDEPAILAGIERNLHRMRGEWDLHFVQSGQEALSKLREQAFDALVTDLRMPGMDGADLLVQAAREHPDMVRFALTASSDRMELLAEGNLTHQYLVKPFDAEMLTNLLKTRLALRNLTRPMASSPTARATPSADVPRVASVAGGAPAARAEVMEPVAVNEALERALTVSNNEWADCAEVIRDLDPELATVPFAPAEFSMLMLSFVVHAAQAVAADVARSGGRGQIRVGTRASGRWAEIRIGDSASSPPETLRTGALETGIGLERVTDRSWQWLLLAHQVITQRHGGTMRLEARAGLGATFVIRLPA